MKLFTVCVLTICVLSGCIGGFTAQDERICDPTINAGADQSVICSTISPSSADFSLMLANLEGIKNNLWTREAAVSFFNEVERILDANNTWLSLTRHIINRLDILREDMGVEIIFLSSYINLPEFNSDMIISEYDKYLLKTHIKHQRERVLALF